MHAFLALLQLLSYGLGEALALALPPLRVSLSRRLSEATSVGAAGCTTHSVTPVSCAEAQGPDALMAHPDHCQLFYYCEEGRHRPTCRQCPAGLHFNRALHVCDWPQQAGCTTPVYTPPADTQPTTVAYELTTTDSNTTWPWSTSTGSTNTSSAASTPSGEADTLPTTVVYEPTTTESNTTWPWSISTGSTITLDETLSNGTSLSSIDPIASTDTSAPDAANSFSLPWTPSASTADNTVENAKSDARTWPKNSNWEDASTVVPGEPSTNEPTGFTASSSIMWKLLN